MAISPTNFEPAICASCGDAFGCGARLDGCWCTEVTVSGETAAAIATEYDGCLCRKCLGIHSVKAVEPSSETPSVL